MDGAERLTVEVLGVREEVTAAREICCCIDGEGGGREGERGGWDSGRVEGGEEGEETAGAISKEMDVSGVVFLRLLRYGYA